MAAAVALVLARWLPAGARRPVTIAAAALFLASGAASGVIGARWQLLPVFAGAAAALPFALAPLLPRRG
ncbi:hypothetical protein ACFRUQ_34635, partial [Streptomyces goshikiensis]